MLGAIADEPRRKRGFFVNGPGERCIIETGIG